MSVCERELAICEIGSVILYILRAFIGTMETSVLPTPRILIILLSVILTEPNVTG